MDANTGDTLLGWDTDQFPNDARTTALAMQVIVNQGGLTPGGLNFDAKLRRESTDVEDLFIAHISGMDTWARALRMVAQMKEDGMVACVMSACRHMSSSFSYFRVDGANG